MGFLEAQFPHELKENEKGDSRRNCREQQLPAEREGLRHQLGENTSRQIPKTWK